MRYGYRIAIKSHRTAQTSSPKRETSCTNNGQNVRFCRFNFQQKRLYKRQFAFFRYRTFPFRKGYDDDTCFQLKRICALFGQFG